MDFSFSSKIIFAKKMFKNSEKRKKRERRERIKDYQMFSSVWRGCRKLDSYHTLDEVGQGAYG